MSSVDAHILSTLEPEERAALEDPEYTAAQAETLKALAAEGAPNDETDGGEGGEGEVLDADGNPVAAAAPAAAPAAPAAEVAAAAPAPAATVEPDDDAPATPLVYSAQLPADYDDQVAKLKTDADALKTSLKEGKLDADAYAEALDAIVVRRTELADLKTKADISAEMNQQATKRDWEQAGHRLAKRVLTEDGFDYRTDDDKRNRLNVVMKALANSDDPRIDKMSMDELLAESHKIAKATYGWSKPAAAPAPAAAAPAAAPAAPAKPSAAPTPPSRKPPVDAVPASLAMVPGGDGPGAVAGEFAEIDSLTGQEYEDAIERLSPAQRARFQSGR